MKARWGASGSSRDRELRPHSLGRRGEASSRSPRRRPSPLPANCGEERSAGPVLLDVGHRAGGLHGGLLVAAIVHRQADHAHGREGSIDRRVASIPFISGMLMSMRTTSGTSCRARATAAAPVPASRPPRRPPRRGGAARAPGGRPGGRSTRRSANRPRAPWGRGHRVARRPAAGGAPAPRPAAPPWSTTARVTCVPWPGALRIVMQPPSSSRRCRMRARPKPPVPPPSREGRWGRTRPRYPPR